MATQELKWWHDALCAQVDTDLFFPEKGHGVSLARQVCNLCPVKAECLEDALVEEYGKCKTLRFGVRGGTTPNARWNIEKQREREVEAA
ncbi:WhiB family transcription factor [Mycobacterium phage MiniLon]|nr:WhiB family transcription factor [Mycobacterium phage MiniLon]